MGDSDKAAKLAAARKKLKQFQQRGRSSSPRSRTSLANAAHPVEVITEKLLEEDNVPTNSDVESQKLKEDEPDVETRTNNNPESDILNVSGSLATVASNTTSSVSVTDNSEEMRSQLAAHVNTISILVSEKNELQHLLNESQQKMHGLESTLDSSSFKITELNSLVSELRERNQLLEQRANDLESRINEEKQEGVSAVQENEDLKEELAQLRLRLATQDEQLRSQFSQNEELKSQVGVLEINIQQLKTAGPPTVDQSIEKLSKECEKLSEECASYKEQVAKIATERDVLSQQYQQYILRLNGQIRTLTSQVESFSAEKSNLEAALVLNKEQMTELEDLVTKLKQERDALQQQQLNHGKEILVPEAGENPTKPGYEMLQKTVDEMEKSKAQLVMDNEQLSRLVLEKENRLQEMHIRVERLETELKTANFGNGTDSNVEREKLVQAMQSDKLAASRAVAQNRQLKSQLEELEKAFISLSNDKLQLTEQLQATQFSSREAQDKVSVMEPELLRLREEVAKLGEQRDATIYWQRELEEAHERIHALTHQNNELKKRVIWNIGHLQRADSHDETSKHSENHNHHDHHTCSGDHEVAQKQFPWEEFEKVKFTLGQLEGRFERAMEDIARLNDEKHKLEHLVLQLQSETETIGEYVTLYQIQRGVLRQRAEELTLARDSLKQQLTELARLMVQLVPQLGAQPLWNQLSQLTNNMEENDTVESDDTITRVTQLLEKIHASNLVTAQDNSLQDVFHFEDSTTKHNSTENFHPCHCCSGKLIDV